MSGRRRKFYREFKDEAVKMVIESSRRSPRWPATFTCGEDAGELGEPVSGGARGRGAAVDDLGAGPAAGTGDGDPGTADEGGVPGKSGGLLRPGVSVSSKYEFIDAREGHYPIVKMCAWAGGVHVGVLRVARPAGLGHRGSAASDLRGHHRARSSTTPTAPTATGGCTPSWPAAASPASPELVRAAHA